MRQDHPHLSLIIIEDGLSSNAPHISELRKHNFHFILGVKEGDHKFLFEVVDQAHQAGQVSEFECESQGVRHRFRFINQAPLNESNPDERINFVEYWGIKPGKTQHFSWVTDFTVTTANVFQIMRGGRARWKVENETFNTLKNQGYHFEHNFGHGAKNLSVVFASLIPVGFPGGSGPTTGLFSLPGCAEESRVSYQAVGTNASDVSYFGIRLHGRYLQSIVVWISYSNSHLGSTVKSVIFSLGMVPVSVWKTLDRPSPYILSTNPSCVLSRRVQFNALWVAILGCLSLKTTLISVEFCKSSG